MTLKERIAVLETIAKDLKEDIKNLSTQIVNHSGIHKWDRIVSYMQLILMVIVIFLLKFKVL